MYFALKFSAEDFAFKTKSARLVPLILAKGFRNEGSFYSNSVIKQIEVRLLSNGQLIETESRTSTLEKETRTLTVRGGKPRPHRRGPAARLDFRKKRAEETLNSRLC